MAKHVLLTFLSDVKKNGPKQGPWTVSRSRYEGIGDTYTTNESAVRYLMQKGWNNEPIRLERIFAFASNTVLEEEVGANHPDMQFPNISIDKHGHSLTHLAYFRKRIEDIVDVSVCLPETGDEKHYSPSDPICIYDDESPDIKRTMSSVIGMSGKIQRYLLDVAKESVEGEAVILHADMSGGFRHAAMMMMAVMRLIQFAGIQIGHVLYSNWTRLANDPVYSGEGVVQEVGDIYGMYDMVSGATEFTNFGSVKSFSDFFATREQSKELEKLLASMRNFDEAIKISRRREFTEAVNNLRESLHEFGTYVERWPEVEEGNIATSADVSDLLMNSLRHRIQHDYKELLADEVDELVYIEWCLQHGYLQQALTLFTESFPDFVNSNEFIFIREEVKKKIEKDKGNDPRDLEFYTLAEYTPDSTPILWLQDNDILKIGAVIKNYLLKLVELEKVNKLIKKAETGKEQEEIKQKYETELQTCYLKIDEAITKKYVRDSNEYFNKPTKIYKEDKKIIKNFLILIKKIYMNRENKILTKLKIDQAKRIYNFLGMDEAEFNDLIQHEKQYVIYAELKRFLNNVNSLNLLKRVLNREKYRWKKKYPERSCGRIEMLLYCNEIELTYLTPAELLSIMEGYLEIKEIRNDSVHARRVNRGGKTRTVAEINSIIKHALVDIQKAKEKRDIFIQSGNKMN